MYEFAVRLLQLSIESNIKNGVMHFTGQVNARIEKITMEYNEAGTKDEASKHELASKFRKIAQTIIANRKAKFKFKNIQTGNLHPSDHNQNASTKDPPPSAV